MKIDLGDFSGPMIDLVDAMLIWRLKDTLKVMGKAIHPEDIKYEKKYRAAVATVLYHFGEKI